MRRAHIQGARFRPAVPEGPEVRRAADALDAALAGQRVTSLTARTRAARAWLDAHPDAFAGATVRRVTSHGKWLVGTLDGAAGDGGGEPLFFASHFLMWGRWQVVAPDDELVTARDRRERARIETPDAVAVLLSAPVFEVGTGDPYEAIPRLASLGPDVLPVDGAAFDADAFRARLAAHPEREVGAVLLDQSVAAGLGNYLRAEVLFVCRISPWRRVADLAPDELDALVAAVPAVSAHAYRHGGRTTADADRDRLAGDASLTYAGRGGRDAAEWATRHYVFRRTNLPCLVCGTPVRQQRQTTATWTDDAGAEAEKQRIVYFCPVCQNVPARA